MGVRESLFACVMARWILCVCSTEKIRPSTTAIADTLLPAADAGMK